MILKHAIFHIRRISLLSKWTVYLPVWRYWFLLLRSLDIMSKHGHLICFLVLKVKWQSNFCFNFILLQWNIYSKRIISKQHYYKNVEHHESLRAIASDSTIFYNLGFELISHVLITEDNPKKKINVSLKIINM